LNLKESFYKAPFRDKLALSLSCWFGFGLLPMAPGTFGTLGAIPLVLWLSHTKVLANAVFLTIFIAIAIWASERSAKLLNRSDPSEVVIDEAAGFLLTFFLLSWSWLIFILGFVLFRFFDIVKPYPIKKCETIGGGLGIVLDDLMAGLYANLSLRLILYATSGN
jgi:phosphatidylglycerophosphatase A